MSVDARNFRSWFVDVLTSLYKQPDAGFAILMIAFPILERYLRQKVGLTPDQPLTDSFFNELAALFPELPNRDNARQFWGVYRNGLLHQVTFSSQARSGTRLPAGALSHDVPRLEIDTSGRFFLNPVAFSKRVIEIVEADFSAFEGSGSGGVPPLPVVYNIPAMGLTAVTGVVSPVTGYVLGTAAPPRKS